MLFATGLLIDTTCQAEEIGHHSVRLPRSGTGKGCLLLIAPLLAEDEPREEKRIGKGEQGARCRYRLGTGVAGIDEANANCRDRGS
jgi:hypothetical protein